MRYSLLEGSVPIRWVESVGYWYVSLFISISNRLVKDGCSLEGDFVVRSRSPARSIQFFFPIYLEGG